MIHLRLVPLLLLPLTAGCAELDAAFAPATPATPVEATQTLDPTPPPPPPPTARTVEEFDTTTQEDRAAAVAVTSQPQGEVRLGTTNVSLGSAAEPGIWLKTGLVTALAPGRVTFPGNGKSVNLELRPSGGDPEAASQMSLAAMRLLEIPLTGLVDVVVFRRPAGSDPSG